MRAMEKHELTMLIKEELDPIFLATVQATEEAVINAMVAAETMTGINNHKVIGLPHERLREVLRKYNRAGEMKMWRGRPRPRACLQFRTWTAEGGCPYVRMPINKSYNPAQACADLVLTPSAAARQFS